MKVSKTINSRIDSTDFSDLPFGKVFSDHMLICTYKNGLWGNPEIIPYGPINMYPGSQVLHYGQSIFEGMKAFKNRNQQLLLFRKDDNFIRFNKSAIRMSIPEIPKEIFINGIEKLISIDSDWCKSDPGYSLYIRPFVFASSECIKASSSKEFTFIIITSPTTTYYPGSINLVIEEHYTRAARGGVGFAKAAGNYAATFYPTKQANSRGFEQVIWTDSVDHKYIEECGTMNIWFRIDNILITPELSDSILNGVTRNSIITLAKSSGINVVERKILVSEIINAHKDGKLLEVFGSGTAVAISPIDSITFKKDKMILPKLKNSLATTLKKELQAIQKGDVDDIYGWTTKISPTVDQL